MSDLVERLRKHINTDEGHYWTGPIMAEAADEIEGLEAENAELRESLKKWMGDYNELYKALKEVDFANWWHSGRRKTLGWLQERSMNRVDWRSLTPEEFDVWFEGLQNEIERLEAELRSVRELYSGKLASAEAENARMRSERDHYRDQYLNYEAEAFMLQKALNEVNDEEGDD